MNAHIETSNLNPSTHVYSSASVNCEIKQSWGNATQKNCSYENALAYILDTI